MKEISIAYSEKRMNEAVNHNYAYILRMRFARA